MTRVLTLLLIAVAIACNAQQDEKFNLGFEFHKDENKLPDGWMKWGTYEISTEAKAQSGKKAVRIISDETGSSFGSIAYSIPAKYSGQTVVLEGYMKTKNVGDGFAGLLLRVDGDGKSLAFDNMQSQNINGTNDWKKYSVTLDYPEGAENIYLGGIMVGKGEAWFDGFVLSIDGENVQTLEEVKAKAELDTEFDKASNIDLSKLTPGNIDDLELLGRVWGFVKYHHPEIAKGNYNWDYELFRFLPEYLAAENKNKKNDLLITWIDSLGKLEKCAGCKPVDENAFLKPDLKWIDGQEANLKNKLLSVYNGRSTGKHYYIGMTSIAGDPQFNNENAFEDMPYPDDGFRLLSLYRYWNMINYFFPYKHLMDKNWNTTLKEYLPLFINAGTELEYELAVLQIIGEVQDTHANLWGGGDKINEWKGENYPAFKVRFIEDKLLVTEYYQDDLKEETGLKTGDIITQINGKSIAQFVSENSKYYPASNEPTRLRNIARNILRSNLNEMNIRYISGNSAEKQKSIKLYPAEDLDIYGQNQKEDGKSYKMLDNNIGYVTLGKIKEADIPQIKKEFKDTKGIVIDIRNYPSTFVPFSLGSYFLSTPTPFVKFTKGSVANPGEFTFSSPIEIPAGEDPYTGKLVVLVNEDTQSQAEYTAMAFRAAENTTIIGSTTAGADGNVAVIMLPGGLRTLISGIGVHYPNGEETQRVGIVPDIEVKPTIEGIRNNRDELLEKAVELIKSE